MRKTILSILCMLSVAVAAEVPSVKSDSVDVVQGVDRLVSVTYELTGADAIVTVDFLTNGVSIGEANFANVAGDVNKVVSPGVHKIYWRADRGWAGNSSDAAFTAAVKVWPLSSPPDILLIDMTSRLSSAKKSLRFYVSESALPDGGLSNKKRYAGECIVMKKVYAAGKTARLGCPKAQASVLATYNSSLSPQYSATFSYDYYFGIYPLTIAQCRMFWEVYPVREASSNKNRWYDSALQYTPATALCTRFVRGDVRGFNWPLDGVENDVEVDAREVDETFTHGNVKYATCISALRNVSGLAKIDLPTKAEWEFAARAGSGFNFYTLDGDIAYDSLFNYKVSGSREKAFAERIGWTEATANLDGNRGYRNVGLKEPNKWGFFDLVGNCPELVLDRRGTPSYAGASALDPRGPESGENMVAMGATSIHNPNKCMVWSVYEQECNRSTIQTETGARFAVSADMSGLGD